MSPEYTSDLPPLKLKKDFKNSMSTSRKVVPCPPSSGRDERKSNTELRFHKSNYDGFLDSDGSFEDLSPWQKE
jgi:hypothetical protein